MNDLRVSLNRTVSMKFRKVEIGERLTDMSARATNVPRLSPLQPAEGNKASVRPTGIATSGRASHPDLSGYDLQDAYGSV